MSIRRKRQLTKIGITIGILAAIITLIGWLSFGSKGLTKKSIYIRELPRSTVMYLACRNPLSLTERILDSEYAGDIKEEPFFRAPLEALRAAARACNAMPLIPRMILRTALSRDAAFALIASDATNIAEGRWYVLADVGNLPGAVLSLTGTPADSLRVGGRFGVKRRVSFRGVAIEEWREGETTVFANAYYRGRLIVSGSVSNIAYFIDFYRAKGPTLAEEHFIRDTPDPGVVPIAWYIHTSRFRASPFAAEEPFAFLAGTLIPGDECFATVRPHARETDITLSMNYHGNASYALSEVFGPPRRKTAHQFFPRSTVLMLSLSARDLGRWYASAEQYLSGITNVPFALALRAKLADMNARTGLAELLSAIGSEGALGVLRGADAYHVVLMCALKDEATAIPALEASLAKRSAGLKKREIRFKDRFIYYYDLGEQKIFFCPIKDRFFFSYDLDALKDVIVSAARNDHLAGKSPYMNELGMFPSHGMLYFNVPLSYEYFSSFGMMRRESFPRIIYAGMRADSDTIHLSGKLLINLERAR